MRNSKTHSKDTAQIRCEDYVHCSEDEDKAKRVTKEIGNGLWVTGDLSKTQSIRRMFEKTGELDSVITVYVTPLFFPRLYASGDTPITRLKMLLK